MFNCDHGPVCEEKGATKINQACNAMSLMPRPYCILYTTSLRQDLPPYPTYIPEPTTQLLLSPELNLPNIPISHNSCHF